MATIDQRFKDIVIEELGVSSNQIVDSANFVTDLGADSLDLVELLGTTEVEFQIEIPVDAAEKLFTVGAAVAYITKQSNR